MKDIISIIIPSHNAGTSLKDLLASIEAQQVQLDVEVIVISNPPSKYAAELLSQKKNVRHFQSNVVGVNHARNIGLQSASGQVIVFLDDDVQLEDKGLLQRHWDLHLRYPKFAAIGGTYKLKSDAVIDKFYHLNQMRWLFRGIKGEQSRYLIGGHFSLKKGCLGPDYFDDRIAFGGSETELFLRYTQRGLQYKLFMNLEVVHRPRLSIPTLVNKIYRQGFGSKYIKNKLGVSTDLGHLNYWVIEIEKEIEDLDAGFYAHLVREAFNAGYHGASSSCSIRIVLKIVLQTVCNMNKVYFKKNFRYFLASFRNLSKK